MATAQSKRDLALKKIAAMLEDQMTESGLTEEEKNEKTAELVAFVNDASASRLAPHAKRPKSLHNEAIPV